MAGLIGKACLLIMLGSALAQTLIPGRITQPATNWVNNAIELSLNNLNKEGVSVTFQFNSESALTAGVAEITFPSGFTVSSATVTYPTGASIGYISGSVLRVSNLTWLANSDNTITIGNVQNPVEARGYGPFGIITRHSNNGQIVDCNAVFGSVGIAPQASRMENFSVAYANGSTGAINASAQAVEFTFTISKDLWKYDLFVITMSDKFQIEASVICESFVASDAINYYNSSIGTSGVGVHNLDCSATAVSSTLSSANSDMTPSYNAQKLYIYGNAYDIDGDGSSMPDAKNVKLRISAITNPWAVYSTLSWAVETIRFQTNTIIEEQNNPDSNLTILKGEMTSATYASSWNVDAVKLYNGAKAFMDASITTGNVVYRNSHAQITFTDQFSNLNTATGSAQQVNCWMIDYEVSEGTNATTCTQGILSRIDITNMAANSAGKQFKFRVLADFQGTSSKISSAKTMIASTNEIIDDSTDVLTLDRSTTYDGLIAASTTGIGISTKNTDSGQHLKAGYDTALAATTGTLQFAQILDNSVTAKNGASVTISFPFSNNAGANDMWFFSTTNQDVLVAEKASPLDQWDGCSSQQSEDVLATSTWTDSSSGYAVTAGSAGNLGTIKLTLGTNVFDGDGNNGTGSAYLATGSAWCLEITQKNAGTSKVQNPQVMSNQSTYYELWVEWNNVNANNSGKYLTTIQPTITANVWQGTDLVTDKICKSTWKGTLMNAFGKLYNTAIPNEVTYYVDVQTGYGSTADSNLQADNAFGSGLTAGDGTGALGASYPITAVKPSTTTTATVEDTSHLTAADSVSIRMVLTTSHDVTTNNAFEFSFPIGLESSAATTYTPTFVLSGFFFNGIDTRIRQEIYYSTDADTALFEGTDNVFALAPAADNMSNTANDTSGITIKMNFKTSTSNNVQNDTVLMVLPAGTQFGASVFTEVTSGTTMTFGSAVLISSTNRSFAYPTAYAQISSSTGGNEFAFGSDGTGGVQITNITSRISSHTEDSTGVIIYDGAGQDNQCADGDLDVQWVTGFLMYKTVKEFSSCEISLAATTVQSPGTTALTQEVSVRTSTEIPEGGSMTLIYALGWVKTTDTTCTVTGLTANSTTGLGPTVTPINDATTSITSFGAVTTSTSISISCDYLLGPSSINATQQVVSSLVSDLGGNEINRWDSTSLCNKLVTVSSATTLVGSSSDWSNTISPRNVQQSNCNGHIKFKLSQTLPKGAEVTIAYPNNLSSALTSISNPKDYVWSTMQYSSVTASGNTLLLTPAVDVQTGTWIEIYIDAGFNTGGDTNISTNGFDVTALWNNISIISDPDQGYSDGSKFTAQDTLTSTITDDSISITVTNAGESSDYVFSWTSSVGYTVGDSIMITFPKEYDLFVGYATQWFTEESNVYYMHCSSTALGLSWCKVDKRCVTITGSVDVASAGTIDVTLHYVHNPTVASSRFFIVSQVAADGTYLAHDTSFNDAAVTLTIPPFDIIQLKSVSASDHFLFNHQTQYTFEFFLGGNSLDADEALYVTFPRQYDLHLSDGAALYSCSTTYLDTSSLTALDVTWNTETGCTTDANTIKLSADGIGETFTSAYQFTWNVIGVSNPEWGETRVAAKTLDMDFDDTDFTLFTDYDDWTNKFWLSTYDASDKRYIQKSYDNLNAAYLGFNNQYNSMTVNDYNPQNNSNRIKVYAGSYTGDIVIKAESDTGQSQMQAKKIDLSARANIRSRTNPVDQLNWTSAEYSFTFFQEYTQITFKVGADISLSKGLYYIDWSKIETGQTSENTSSVHYHHPVRTLVEVVGKVNNKYAFTCETLVADAIKGTSTPYIGISTTNSPFSDVSITFGLQGESDENNQKISFTPSSVVFGPNDLTKYFTIDIPDDYDRIDANQQVLTFTRSGTDAEAFSMPENMAFNIQEQPDDIAAGIVTDWGQGTCTGTSCSFLPSVSQTGSLWWAISARQQGADDYVDATCTPIETIKANAAAPNATTLTDVQQANADKTANDYAATETDPLIGETWAGFQQRKYSEHLQDAYYGVENIVSVTIPASIDATWLWTGTKYQICAYVENVYGEISNYSANGLDFSVVYFETTAMDSNRSWSVTASGSATMKRMSADIVRDIVSYYQGVNPERNTVTSKTETTSRRLQTTFSMTWEAYLAVDRRAEAPSTETIATLAYTDILRVGTDLDPELGIGNSMGDYTQSSYVASQVSVSFTTAPAFKALTNSSVTITFLSDNDYGETACVVVAGSISNSNLKPTATQVYLGLDRNNAQAVSAKKIDSATENSGVFTKVTEISLDGLNEGTEYSAFCTASNGVPVFPSYVTYADDDNYRAVTFTTSGTAQEAVSDDDFALLASCNVVSLFLMITVFVFN